ncbi:MAG: hypothetical protein SPF43_09500, partial [Bacteroidales bacterium]|nr:hypothetical protein [Bacteroidales bacterium]
VQSSSLYVHDMFEFLSVIGKEARKKIKIQEGCDVYLFATTLSDGGNMLVFFIKYNRILF